jgi:retron-type reverse transcriptase
VLSFHREGDRVTLDADIAGFFDNIPHKLIVDAVHAEVADGNILNLVEKFLAAGVTSGIEGSWTEVWRLRLRMKR